MMFFRNISSCGKICYLSLIVKYTTDERHHDHGLRCDPDAVKLLTRILHSTAPLILQRGSSFTKDKDSYHGSWSS
jgi:hypothetical protein